MQIFLSGRCRYKDRCKTQDSSKNDTIKCKFADKCKFGDRCRFRHESHEMKGNDQGKDGELNFFYS